MERYMEESWQRGEDQALGVDVEIYEVYQTSRGGSGRQLHLRLQFSPELEIDTWNSAHRCFLKLRDQR